MQKQSLSRFVVESLEGPPALVERLGEMGFFPGVVVEMGKRLPFAGPWILHLESTSFALREEEIAALKIRSL